MPSLNIIGAGQVGQCLGSLLAKHANIRIHSVLNRSLASAKAACDFLGQGQACEDFSQVLSADYYLIAVHDAELYDIGQQLSQTIKLDQHNLVFHCSGALSSQVLAPLADTGAAIASLHPLKSFIDPALSVETFYGTTCTIEGSETALALLRKWVELIGGNCLEIQPEQKIVYHAGAVIACNYLAAITATALKCWQHIGIDNTQGLTALQPMMQTALKQILSKGPTEALTGPIARGETAIIEKQIAALTRIDPEIAMLYKMLGNVALKLARGKKKPANRLEEVESLLV